MAGYTYDKEVMKRRITAYLDFLMTAYGTDADGLADIANVRREDMAEYIDCCAAGDYDDLNCNVLAQLGNLTRTSFSWLFAEEPEAEHEADGRRLGAAAQTASADSASAERLRGAMDVIHGVIYALDALADMRTEASYTLRNFARELDGAFCELYEIAEALEQAHGLDGGGVA